ncbi:multiple epidermal growth factor-like domains protein 6 [Mercenaria mercenaria]|uniref:multiple epidermal growth factor-like domains protein 6 n=1 Tax=Mercenaria mercenaria TaxID=6596 RepID=UPI00234FB2DD|nr:multiple epidermal growth factor-like domains protein 6 [Mercenaria mercenaria]
MISTYGLLSSGTFVIFATLLIAQSLSCPKHCETCINDNTCERCVDRYYNGHWYDDQSYPEFKNCSLRCNEDCKACTSYKTCTTCKPGFCIDIEKRTCQIRCNDIHCESCSSCDVCTKCHIWYYGKTCEKNCEHGCEDGRCDMKSGYCICRQNFQGHRCDKCFLGKYGTNCNKNCAKGCEANVCDKQSGACLKGCKPGFKAPHCDSCVDGLYYHDSTCKNCPNTCLKCTSSNHCSLCKPRSWGNKCQNTCPQTCKSCVFDTICQECIQGYYGRTCNVICPGGCEGNICSKNDGLCQKCKPGYNGQHCYICDAGFWGQHCNTSCSRGCLTDRCYKDTGVCPDGCKYQFTGEKCDSCVNGFHGKECLKCPRKCVSCTSNTQCNHCLPGNWGAECEHNCLPNCKECKSNNDCSHCEKGYFGLTCSMRCPPNCYQKTCYQENGSCTKCMEGFYGVRCESRCPETCATSTCRIDGNCVACAEGYFGVKCSNVCSPNCKEKCLRTNGHCRSCIDGYFGDLCDRNCPENCSSCLSATKCLNCKTGFKGNICENECSNCKYGTKCRQHDGYCEEDCADGLYDTMCDKTCLKECKTCARSSHFKCSSCIHGKYGRRSINGEAYLTCKLDCSTTCLNNSCNEENGRCLHGCFQGLWGAKCDSLCPTNCKNGKCFDNDGACSEGCKEGYFGRKCSLRCNHNDSYCSECLADDNGQYEGCVMCTKGYYPTNGLTDQLKHKRCGPCSPNCSRNECNTTNGFCLHGCINGLWGRKCEKSCDRNCLGCSQTNGDCLKCTDGRYGIKCLENCSTNCGRRNGVPVCSQNDGQCLNDCSKNTSYGTYCENECNKNCLIGECQWKTGHCILGCINGFHGTICDMPCSKNCVNNTCNRLGGDCSVGCRLGFEGTTCTRVTGRIGTGVFIGTGSALVVILIGIITTVICIKFHKRSRTKPSLEMRERHRNINVDHVEVENRDDMNSRPNVAAGSSRESRNVDNKTIETKVEYASISKTERFLTQVDSSEEVEIELYEEENLMGVEATQTTMFTFNDDDTYYNTAAVLKRRVQINKLKEFVSKKTMDDFIKEFKELPVGLLKPYGASQTTENFKKNRYRGLYPCKVFFCNEML